MISSPLAGLDNATHDIMGRVVRPHEKPESAAERMSDATAPRQQILRMNGGRMVHRTWLDNGSYVDVPVGHENRIR
jgi:hypothetical protein